MKLKISCSPQRASVVSDGKESARNAGDLGSVPGLGRSPGEGNDYHSSILKTPGVSAGQGRLAHCSPWGRKALDETELLNNDKKVPRTPGSARGADSSLHFQE